jgi:transcriptional regulator with XRE-family HTH domain
MASDLLAVPAATSLAARLRLARKAAGLDIDEAARRIGVSVSTWTKTEAGARLPRRGELIAFAQVTGQDLGFFGASLDEDTPTLPLLPGAVKADNEPRE